MTFPPLHSGTVSEVASPFGKKALQHAAGVYDYVFTGGGCAALSLLLRLQKAGLLQDKKVLVIDQDQKNKNDRTWCFWEREAGLFEPIVHKSWQQLSFYSNYFSGPLNIAPYTYKLIRGIDFYRYCFEHLAPLSQIDWLQAGVTAINNGTDGAEIEAGGQTFRGTVVFNSVLPPKPRLHQNQYWLLQHFKGWVVETDKDVFDPLGATLMDFRVSQKEGCTFVYVLPFTKRTALVEYTLFSKNLLPKNAYNAALQQYLQQFLSIEQYRIRSTEFGIIPMTNYTFPKRSGAVLHMGTAGGYTKASSGYTFRFIQKNAARIVASLQQHGHPFAATGDAARFGFYDSVLLYILQHGTLPGDRIFARLFQKNKAASVLKFLDNETALSEELRLIGSLPVVPFSRAALAHIAAGMGA